MKYKKYICNLTSSSILQITHKLQLADSYDSRSNKRDSTLEKEYEV